MTRNMNKRKMIGSGAFLFGVGLVSTVGCKAHKADFVQGEISRKPDYFLCDPTFHPKGFYTSGLVESVREETFERVHGSGDGVVAKATFNLSFYDIRENDCKLVRLVKLGRPQHEVGESAELFYIPSGIYLNMLAHDELLGQTEIGGYIRNKGYLDDNSNERFDGVINSTAPCF